MITNAISLGLLSMWSHYCAKAIEAIGSDTFGPSLLKSLHAIAPCDSALFLAYHAEEKPTVIFDAFDHPLRENAVSSYVQDFYRLDPFYTHAFQHEAPGFLRMSDISPRCFTETKYFRAYYRRSHVTDEINFVAPTDEGIRLVLSYERSMKTYRFSSDEIQMLQSIGPQVTALLLRHWSEYTPIRGKRQSKGGYEEFKARLSGFESDILTRREHEIVKLVLEGFSNQSVAELLGLSIQTIKVHRRNIYSKLKISSLSELYHFAIETAWS